MIPFYQFHGPSEYDLLADFETEFKQWAYTACPGGGQHGKTCRRIGELHYAVKHNDRQEDMIWGREILFTKASLRDSKARGSQGSELDRRR